MIVEVELLPLLICMTLGLTLGLFSGVRFHRNHYHYPRGPR